MELEAIETPKGFDGGLIDCQRNLVFSNGLIIHIHSDMERSSDVFLFDELHQDIVHMDNHLNLTLSEVLVEVQAILNSGQNPVKELFGW